MPLRLHRAVRHLLRARRGRAASRRVRREAQEADLPAAVRADGQVVQPPVAVVVGVAGNNGGGERAVGVPEFYQPPRSGNVTVVMHAVFSQSDVSRLVVGELSAQRRYMEIRIAGSIDARTHVMNFPLPKIQFSIDCTIGTNYTDIVLREGIESVITRKALLVSELPHLSQKCSIKIDIRSRGKKRASLDELGC
uniref:Late embryogenesis abundant protein LEA-2 subgroup domain-containing protein n=1 Tax=Oryza brachyantha TaxID=4533 RepID=J3MXS0_ORYBR